VDLVRCIVVTVTVKLVARLYFVVTFKQRRWPNLIKFPTDFVVVDNYAVNIYK
jgi:hypothetical protein